MLLELLGIGAAYKAANKYNESQERQTERICESNERIAKMKYGLYKEDEDLFDCEEADKRLRESSKLYRKINEFLDKYKV